MGTEVLRPQDLLVERFHVSPPSFHRRRNFPANGNLTNLMVNRRPNHTNTGAYKKKSPKPDKRKVNETKKVTHGAAAETRRSHCGPAMGQVTILRRGESLDSLTAKTKTGSPEPKSLIQKPADDLVVLGTRIMSPDSQEIVPKQIRLSLPPLPDVYAGSAFSLSPSPRSLPLPSFFNKKQQDDIKISSFDDPATRDLRRLLRLD